jgi:peptidoglycan/xylan/chitin deacetylase (PgdA/CDA1 family)
MLEQWADDAAPGLGPMGNPLKPGTLDLQARSWAEYGPKTGIWRLLEILAEQNVRGVVYVSGILAERYPDVIRAIVQAGHPVAAHGWTQDVIPSYQSLHEEETDVRRTIEAIIAAGAVPPRGWISPRCTPSFETASIVRTAGLDWHADYFDADLPRQIDVPAGRLTAIPFTMDVNDLPHSVRYGNDPSSFVKTLADALDGYALTSKQPACLDITVHAHVYGRAPGAVAFREALGLLKDHPLAFQTDHQALADLFYS